MTVTTQKSRVELLCCYRILHIFTRIFFFLMKTEIQQGNLGNNQDLHFTFAILIYYPPCTEYDLYGAYTEQDFFIQFH